MQLTFIPPSKQPTSQCLSLSLRVSNQSPLFPEAQFSHSRLLKVLLKAHSKHVGREGQASLSYLHGGSRRGGNSFTANKHLFQKRSLPDFQIPHLHPLIKDEIFRSCKTDISLISPHHTPPTHLKKKKICTVV